MIEGGLVVHTKDGSMQFKLSDHGEVFSTRPRGAELATLLEREARASAAEVVELDFEGVNALSYSFADEFVGKLAERSAARALPFGIAVSNVSPAGERVILGSLERRGVDRAVLSHAS